MAAYSRKRVVKKQLYVEGSFPPSPTAPRILGPPIVTNFSDPSERDNLQAVYTKKHLATSVLGSSLESCKTSRNGEDGARRITTRIVRKVTTLTRGEEQNRAEDLTKRATAVRCIQSKEDVAHQTETVEAKRVKV